MSGDAPKLRLLPPELVPLPEPQATELVEALARLLLRHVSAPGSGTGVELDLWRPSQPPRSP